MEIKLISQDSDVLRICREIMGEIASTPWSLAAVTPQEACSGSDLVLWDFQSNFPIPGNIVGSPAKHLFLARAVYDFRAPLTAINGYSGLLLAETAQLGPHEEQFYFDGDQIEQVLINILDNACKFTPNAGSIEIRGYPLFWERRSGNAMAPWPNERRQAARAPVNVYRMDIRDSGTAIAGEHLDCIFEEYTSYSGGQFETCTGR